MPVIWPLPVAWPLPVVWPLPTFDTSAWILDDGVPTFVASAPAFIICCILAAKPAIAEALVLANQRTVTGPRLLVEIAGVALLDIPTNRPYKPAPLPITGDYLNIVGEFKEVNVAVSTTDVADSAV